MALQQRLCLFGRSSSIPEDASLVTEDQMDWLEFGVDSKSSLFQAMAESHIYNFATNQEARQDDHETIHVRLAEMECAT